MIILKEFYEKGVYKRFQLRKIKVKVRTPLTNWSDKPFSCRTWSLWICSKVLNIISEGTSNSV
ncbi:MAG: hypothetical protein ATN31_09985 [Candidatus Epulonipiscioides saccharophilum]|nr:MAG: hypothetical protein ATN31_09985 [Epulopiscium sp. AS2M-Bin001]